MSSPYEQMGGHNMLLNQTFTKPDDFLVEGLEAVQPAYSLFDGKMYAGMLPADNGDRTGLFTMFWLFEPTTQEIPDTVVLWLNGGPGCSSFNCGVMMEHSPVTQPLHDAGYCCLKATPELSYNEHAWTRGTTMLYVEHPIGTGFSYGHPYPQTEEEASGDLDAFLQNFFNMFEHLKTSRFYVFGESYAGMFVPSVSRYINRANKKGGKDRFIIPLAGAALGNGWIDAKIQGPATIDYSWWHGMIDKPTRDALHQEWDNCMARLDDKNRDANEPPPFHPFNVQDDCGIMWGILQAAGNNNAYDVTTWDPNVDQITFSSQAFYNSEPVKRALHVLDPEHVWDGCQAGSGRRRLSDTHMLHRRLYMDNDRPLSVTPYIAELLDDGIPVIVYNGDRDMTTNMVGQELCLNGMDWNGKDGWLDAPRGLWRRPDGYPAGWVKEYKNLTFAVVYNSGHMVPYNAPQAAYDLLKRVLKSESFIDEEAPQIRVKAVKGAKDIVTKYSSSLLKAGMVGGAEPLDAVDAVEGDIAPNHILAGNKAGAGLTDGAFMVIVALLVGFLMGVLTMKRASGSATSRGYRRVPDVSLAN